MRVNLRVNSIDFSFFDMLKEIYRIQVFLYLIILNSIQSRALNELLANLLESNRPNSLKSQFFNTSEAKDTIAIVKHVVEKT